MTLWMTLRIGGQDWDRAGDNLGLRPCHQSPRAQRSTGPGNLSTLAVHKIGALTCTDAAIPRIHRAYYDYHLSIYRDPKNQVALDRPELQAGRSRDGPRRSRTALAEAGRPSRKPGSPTLAQARLS